MASTRTAAAALAAIWLPVSGVMLLAPVWMTWGRWRTIIEGSPITIGLAALSLVGGVVGLIWAIASLVTINSDRPRRMSLGFRVSTVISLVVLVLALLLAGALAWARPHPADDRALAAMGDTPRVRLVDRPTVYELQPTPQATGPVDPGATTKPQPPSEPWPTAMVFFPGAHIDARAYAAMLRPIAETGVLVIVIKEPLGVALLAGVQAEHAIARHPEVKVWVVAGHSLGGVEAAHVAATDARFVALVLWGSYSDRQVPDRVRVLSVSGSADGLTTPADVAGHRHLLPVDAQLSEVSGANHACFGDFGELRGDGPSPTDRAAAQAEIRKATIGFLDAVAGQA